MSDKEKIEDLDMRYRLAIWLLVMWSNKHFDEITAIIDKAMGKPYWNFLGSDKEWIKN